MKSNLLLTFFLIFGLWHSLAAQPLASDDPAMEALTSASSSDKNALLGALGMPDKPTFSLANIFACIIFNGVGFIAFMYGKKNSLYQPMVCGIALMAYPYFVRNTALLYAIGTGLCIVLFVWKE